MGGNLRKIWTGEAAGLPVQLRTGAQWRTDVIDAFQAPTIYRRIDAAPSIDATTVETNLAGYAQLQVKPFPWMKLVSAASPALGHHVWITLDKAGGDCRAIVNYGHPGDRPPALADKIVDFSLLAGETRTSLMEGLSQTQTGAAVTAASKPFACAPALLSLHYENGFWVKTKGGRHRNATRLSVPDAADSLWSVKFAKAVTAPGAPWRTTAGFALEIVPLADPAATKPGESLPVRVLFRGAPLPGAAVERTDGITPLEEETIPRFTTDKDGVASVPIATGGPQLLAVDHKLSPSGTPALANADLYNATFAFVAREAP